MEALVRSGVTFDGDGSQDEQLWAWLEARSRFGKIGRGTTMCRLLSGPKALIDHSLEWPVDEFERSYVCLEMDFLGSRKLTPIVLHGAAGASTEIGESSGPTSGRPTVDDAAIRSVAQNAMVISHLMLLDRSSERFAKMLGLVGEVLLAFT